MGGKQDGAAAAAAAAFVVGTKIGKKSRLRTINLNLDRPLPLRRAASTISAVSVSPCLRSQIASSSRPAGRDVASTKSHRVSSRRVTSRRYVRLLRPFAPYNSNPDPVSTRRNSRRGESTAIISRAQRATAPANLFETTAAALILIERFNILCIKLYPKFKKVSQIIKVSTKDSAENLYRYTRSCDTLFGYTIFSSTLSIVDQIFTPEILFHFSRIVESNLSRRVENEMAEMLHLFDIDC